MVSVPTDHKVNDNNIIVVYLVQAAGENILVGHIIAHCDVLGHYVDSILF
jgi:predicted enzyme involved in methoxymalonyl-ACP biosynthesis